MKRFSAVLFLALFALNLATPFTAHAGRWVQEEVFWKISGRGNAAPHCIDPTGICIRDTIRTSIGPVDTTSAFSIDNATVPPRGAIAPGITGLAAANTPAGLAPNDTTTVAWLVVQSDSTAAPTAPALTGITALIDGRLGGFGPVVALGAGWVKADSCLANGAAGGGMILADETVAFPIRTVSIYGSIFRFGQLRARITGVGGAVGIAAARVFIRYYTTSGEDQ